MSNFSDNEKVLFRKAAFLYRNDEKKKLRKEIESKHCVDLGRIRGLSYSKLSLFRSSSDLNFLFSQLRRQEQLKFLLSRIYLEFQIFIYELRQLI
jgi:hypothetical protein